MDFDALDDEFSLDPRIAALIEQRRGETNEATKDPLYENISEVAVPIDAVERRSIPNQSEFGIFDADGLVRGVRNDGAAVDHDDDDDGGNNDDLRTTTEYRETINPLFARSSAGGGARKLRTLNEDAASEDEKGGGGGGGGSVSYRPSAQTVSGRYPPAVEPKVYTDYEISTMVTQLHEMSKKLSAQYKLPKVTVLFRWDPEELRVHLIMYKRLVENKTKLFVGRNVLAAIGAVLGVPSTIIYDKVLKLKTADIGKYAKNWYTYVAGSPLGTDRDMPFDLQILEILAENPALDSFCGKYTQIVYGMFMFSYMEYMSQRDASNRAVKDAQATLDREAAQEKAKLNETMEQAFENLIFSNKKDDAATDEHQQHADEVRSTVSQLSSLSSGAHSTSASSSSAQSSGEPKDDAEEVSDDEEVVEEDEDREEEKEEEDEFKRSSAPSPLAAAPESPVTTAETAASDDNEHTQETAPAAPAEKAPPKPRGRPRKTPKPEIASVFDDVVFTKA